ncbi:hypothetical protein P170DRAFT_350937 [Aspergillus steynii IBT 23096]|uniref:Ubiquitin-conjugating enzyme E2-binding protein n=1 Tax=Aspergillus steynii IBT 23096 TaxID=1392250 RepID=A0A2I2GIG2_9EURO|nr:uncharacterized protein P170DRAFT_350937 [Aspergillus steynii IBT 23096]PLB52637.1 hypothetical protein P170DRAFT_350937 [Aspergillus steynii IBT 23096]
MSPETNQDQDPILSLHAELLPNIRHITLYVSLPAHLHSQGIQPSISLSQSRRSITVSLPAPFDHVSDTIKLPARVSEASHRLLALAQQRDGGLGEGKCATGTDADQREYSFRMQIDSESESLLSRDEPMDGFVPWTTRDMVPATRLRCRQCEGVVLDSPARDDVDAGSGSPSGWVWKDLPSGNWAEMMDFWHCHKPDPEPEEGEDKGDEDPNATVKGYGAANQLVAIPGTVLVDVATFLVAEAECKGLKQVQPESTAKSSLELQRELRCENCDFLVGMEDTIFQGWRLFKTSLSASTPPGKQDGDGNTAWHSHSVETVVAAQLLELIERESTRRFVIHSGQRNGLLLWVFNPDLWYSNSSPDHSVTAQRAMKVLFQTVADVDEMLHPERGKASSLSLDELRLPSYVFSAVSEALESGSKMLPGSARSFREWRVAVMHRFDRLKG